MAIGASFIGHERSDALLIGFRSIGSPMPAAAPFARA
jgi:hypothetical protein